MADQSNNDYYGKALTWVVIAFALVFGLVYLIFTSTGSIPGARPL